MGPRSIGGVLLVVCMGFFLSCNLFSVAAAQGIQPFPQGLPGMAPGGFPGGRVNLASPANALPGAAQGSWWGALYNDYWDFLRRTSLTSASVGIFYGGGTIHVDDSIGWGQNQGLLQSDFAAFEHHRIANLRDGYVKGSVGIGPRGMEFLTFDAETNFRTLTDFRQYTDAGNFPSPPLSPDRWYRGALGVLVLGNEESGEISLNNRNQYWAFDLYTRVPIFPAWDLLLGYKWNWIKSNIDPLSASTPPGTGGTGYASYPVFPGQEGWRPAWRDGTKASTTEFGMYQQVTWNGPFIGAGMANRSPDFDWSLDVRLYPWLFGEYTFTWSGAYIDPDIFVPGIWGAQATTFSGNRRFAIDVDFHYRSFWRNSLIADLEARYSYATMSGSCVEYQTLDNIYFATGHYSQDTPESLNIRQQLWMVGGNLGIGF